MVIINQDTSIWFRGIPFVIADDSLTNQNTALWFRGIPMHQLVGVAAPVGWDEDFNGVANANIAEVNGVAKANIETVVSA